MAALRTLFARLLKNEAGAELADVAVVTGLIVVAALIAIAFFGRRLATQWSLLKVAKF